MDKARPGPATRLKHCSKCGRTQERSAFARDSNRADRLQPYCRECVAAYQKTYYARNRERIIARTAARQLRWERENPALYNAKWRAWYRKNADKVRERKRLQRATARQVALVQQLN